MSGALVELRRILNPQSKSSKIIDDIRAWMSEWVTETVASYTVDLEALGDHPNKGLSNYIMNQLLHQLANELLGSVELSEKSNGLAKTFQARVFILKEKK